MGADGYATWLADERRYLRPKWAFGGFLGIGDSYHPLPWSVLTYDTSQGGYVVDLGRDRLMGASTYSASDASRWSDRSYTGVIDDYYGVTPYGLR